MPIYIQNSLKRAKEEFRPLDHPHVSIYTCGVTVYDDCHIGHARSLYIFNLIRNYLSYRGFQVRFVRNITDIDDKIINRANELGTDWQVLVEKYIERYHQDLSALGLETADIEPRATENIPEMVDYIRALIDKGHAYATATGVYFRVRSFKDYGKLSGQGIDQMATGVRKDADETKDDPLDFALWKMSKPGEPFWPSPWGNGRPGWHIECSVMSRKFLKTDTLDIHAGGRDLIVPHHENEIAQAEALTGKPFAKYWIHHGLLTIDGQKMSKSLGNFVTVKDALKGLPRDHASDILKDLFFRVHYSSPLNYSAEAIREAKEEIRRFAAALEYGPQENPEAELLAPKEIKETILARKREFEESMDDDFNTAAARAALCKLVSECNAYAVEYENAKNEKLRYAVEYAKSVIRSLARILGLSLAPIDRHDPGWGDGQEIDEVEVEKKIELRASLKKEKKFTEADQIRKELEAKGIILEDAKGGVTTWRRKI